MRFVDIKAPDLWLTFKKKKEREMRVGFFKKFKQKVKCLFSKK